MCGAAPPAREVRALHPLRSPAAVLVSVTSVSSPASRQAQTPCLLSLLEAFSSQW